MKKPLPKKFLLPFGILLLAAALFFGILKFRDVFHNEQPQDVSQNQPVDSQDTEQQPAQEEEPVKEPEPEEKPDPEPTPRPAVGPTEGVGTLSWVVNKTRPLNPKTYIPPNLVAPNVKVRASTTVRSDVAKALQGLFAAAKSAGHDPMLSSGYRSYNTQVSVYNSYVARDGQAAADTYSARPGYSEHQTGLAADICNASNCVLEEAFGNTPLGKWLAANVHTYGFTIRYKQGKQNITGYTYEPWHLRYVGTDLASKLFQSGKTLEEHFGLPAAPTYK